MDEEFKRWFEAYIDSIGPYIPSDTERDMVREAWKIGAATEREACTARAWRKLVSLRVDAATRHEITNAIRNW